MHHLQSQPREIVLKYLSVYRCLTQEEIFFSKVEKTIQSAILLAIQPRKSFSWDCLNAAPHSNFQSFRMFWQDSGSTLAERSTERILQAHAGGQGGVGGRHLCPFLPETGLAATISVLHCPWGSCWFFHKILCKVLSSTLQACLCKSNQGVLDFGSRSLHIHKKSHWAKPQTATSLEPPMSSEWSAPGRRRSGSCGPWGRFSWDSHSSLWRVSMICCSERIPGSVTPRREQTGKPARRSHSQCRRDTWKPRVKRDAHLPRSAEPWSCSQWQFSGWGWILETPEEHPCWRYTEGKRFALICWQSRCGSGRGWSSFFIRNNSPPSQTEFSQIRKQCHSLGMSISQQCSDNASYWWMLGHETRAKTLGIRVNSQWTAPTFMLFPCGLDWESERNSDYYR